MINKESFIYFLSQVGIFVITLLLISSIIYLKVERRKGSDYLAAIVEKHQRINTLESPKLILVGGSNLAFGIDSKLLESSLQIPVVNMGLHGDLGLSFMLEEVKYKLKEGDVVLLSIEYLLGDSGNYRVKNKISHFFKKAEDFYDTNYIEELKIVLRELQHKYIFLVERYLFQKVNSIDSTNNERKIYSRDAFNEYGDNIAHLNFRNLNELKGRTSFRYIRWTGIELINDFHKFAINNGARVYFIFPAYPLSQYSRNQSTIHKIENDLKTFLNVPVLASSYSFAYPDTMFYDTVYHLNSNGRKKRSLEVSKLLNELL